MKISAVISDVDGTLVTDDAVLTDRAIAAVAMLRSRNIAFAMISGRAPRGLATLITQLDVTAPCAGFNGGIILTPSMAVLSQHLLSPEAAAKTIDLMEKQGVEAWVYTGQEWLVKSLDGAHTSHEQKVLGFPPTIVENFDDVLESVAKIVGISDDFALLAQCEQDLQRVLGNGIYAARSHPHHMDVTNPDANKGSAIKELARLMAVPLDDIAVIGDGGNDMLMFAKAGRSIAMGNAPPDVQQAADFVTDRNGDEGFAKAIERFVIGAE